MHLAAVRSEGRYTLSSRAVMELQPYLKSTYDDEVLECTSCMEIVTKVCARAGISRFRSNEFITISGNIVLHAQLQVPPTQSLLQITHEHAPDMPLMPG